MLQFWTPINLLRTSIDFWIPPEHLSIGDRRRVDRCAWGYWVRREYLLPVCSYNTQQQRQPRTRYHIVIASYVALDTTLSTWYDIVKYTEYYVPLYREMRKTKAV